MEGLGEVKKLRAQSKSLVTRHMNKIPQLIAEEKLPETKEKTAQLIEAFNKFEEVCEKYQSLLESDEEVEESEAYFYEMQKKYIAVLNNAKDWVRTSSLPRSDVKPGLEPVPAFSTPVAELSREVFGMMNLPKAEIDVFSGDPMKFHSFMQVFEECVEKTTSDDNVRLTRLLQYTSGKAKEAIRSCPLMGEGGYKQAREILEKRFGNKHLITECVLRNIRQGKAVKSPDEMRHLADELVNCHVILKKMGKLNEIDSQTLILDVINRFPMHIRFRWKRQAMDTKRELDRYPDFQMLVEFISKEIEEVCDPVYGSIGKKPAVEVKVKKMEGASSSFSTSLDAASSPSGTTHRTRWSCVLCNSEHRLFACQVFKSMKPTERLQVVLKNKLCKNCLLSNHNTDNCRKSSVCDVNGCGQKHTRFIHINGKDNGVTRQGNNDSSVSVVNAHTSTGGVVHMPIVPVKINGCYDTCALLDTASTNTFCTKSLAKAIGLRGRSVNFMLSTLSQSGETKSSSVVDFDVSSADGKETLKLNNVYLVESIPISTPQTDLNVFPHLQNLSLASPGRDVHVLIGQDHAEALVPMEVRKGKPGEPFATQTLFGWSVNGPGHVDGKTSHRVISHFISTSQLDEKVNNLWHMENDGLTYDDLSNSQEDKRVIELWDQECLKVDGHYVIPIPWKPDISVPNNVTCAISRLKSLKSSLVKKGLFDRYNDEVLKLVHDGHVELIPETEVQSLGRVWYLPHHAVISDKKPNKIRIVFDCAAKYAGQSLNDKCFQGPDLNNKLLNVLLRFRQHHIAITADIKAMYYQVRVPKVDRDVLRFLWFDGIGNIIHYRMTGHVFGGVWCASSSAYAVQRSLADAVDVDASVSHCIRKNFYVDDCLVSTCSRDEAITIIQGTRKVLKEGGFNLTKFVTNDAALLSSIPVNDRADEVKVLEDMSCSRALGIHWNVKSDQFYFDVNVKHDGPVTRRSVLSILGSIFDPLGLLNPVIVSGKMIFQDATRLKLQWDEEVTDELKGKWKLWIESLCCLADVKFPRCFKPNEFDDGALVELHHFSDASERAYGCCSYVRCLNRFGQIYTALLLSKCKLAPVKQITIPRLELQAAVLSAQIDRLLRHELDVEVVQTYFWVDSELVLKYINNENRRFQVFVGNRISLIRNLTNPSQWHHIDGGSNPADVITRGTVLDSSTVISWSSGPEFLQTYKSQWPVDNVDVSLDVDDPEVKTENKVKSIMCSVFVGDDPIDKLLNYYSSWSKLRTAVAWLLRLQAKYRKNGECLRSRNLSAGEIIGAETVILKYVQNLYYAKEIKQLSADQPVSKLSTLKSLCPMLDEEGLLRVGGRLKHAQIGCSSKHPCIVPYSHHVAILIVRHYHDVAHLGTEWVVSLVRRQFWITRIRSVVKKVAHQCVKCRKLFGNTCTQKMADLPPERLCHDKPPFTYVGMDCFGPFYVKQGRSEVKRYGCLFSCLNTRAVHLEKLCTLDTDSLINAFRRFVSRRGTPSKLWSDNGTNFVGAKSEMDKCLNQLDADKVHKFSASLGVEWVFNPPGASHMGGLWERMIRTVRKVLLGLFDGRISLSDEMLDTLFCEVEALVNSRPITKIADNVSDAAALTPNHLLLLRECPSLPPGLFDSNDLYKRRWRCVQHLSGQFWRRWLREYVPQLMHRHKWTEVERNIQVGDLVLIKDENTPRGLWPMGLVVEVHVGRDSLVRAVKIRTKATHLVRPITKVVLLEGMQ